MGPVRGGLILSLLASSTMAEVCDKERPRWDPASGPASMLDEFFALILNPFVLGMLCLTAVAILSKWRIPKWILAVVWLSLSILIGIDHYGPVLNDVRWFAMQEGCIGSPLLFIALAIAICAKLIHGALRPRLQEKT